MLRGLAILLASALLVAGCGPFGLGQQQETITIAVQPTQTAEELTASASEIADFLSERVGQPVELVFPTTYAGVVESLRFGHADAAFMSAWPARLAWTIAGADVALAEVREVVIGEEKREETFYYSYWVVRPDSPADSLADLRGMRAAFPSPLSTSGYVAPLARLVELGLVPAPGTGQAADPGDFFGEVTFSGGYAQGWRALQAGQVDVTVIAGDVTETLYREVLAGTRVIEQQGPVPSHSVAFARDLDPATKQRLIDALLELGHVEHRDLMRKFISGIFVGFERTTAKEHLGSLDAYLEITQLAFLEQLR